MAASNISDLTVRTYDEYLVKKLESAIMSSSGGAPYAYVVYSPFELAFEYAMKRQQVENINQMKFPLIICHRTSGFTLSNMTHRVLGTKLPVYYVSYKYMTDDEVPQEVHVTRYFNVINVDIPYNIEILTKDENQAFEVAQELLFFLLREPYVDVPKYLSSSTVPTDEKTSLRFAFMVDNEVADNTTLENEADTGKLYRVTLSATLNDAALSRDVRGHVANSVHITVEDGFPDDIPGNLFREEINIE